VLRRGNDVPAISVISLSRIRLAEMLEIGDRADEGTGAADDVVAVEYVELGLDCEDRQPLMTMPARTAASRASDAGRPVLLAHRPRRR